MVIYASDVGISDVVAEDDVGRLGGSTGATGLAAEARAAKRLRAAVRAWLARRRVAAEVARVRAEWEEPGWLRASALELAELQRAEAANAGAAQAVAEAAAAAEVAEAEA